MGYLQKAIIKLGKEKGFVTSVDVKKLFKFNIDIEMNKLVLQGHFEKGEDCIIFIKWKYIGENKI
ncbi:MAG: hypothetical protein AABY22_01565 [Nanoarchaeota archaeon]